MNIIIPNLSIPILHDIAQCLESVRQRLDINLFFWNPQQKSIIDVFDETHPDLIFLHESQLDEAFKYLSTESQLRYIVVATTKLPPDLPKAPELVITYSQFVNLFTELHTLTIQPLTRIPQIHNAQYDQNIASDILINTTGVTINQTIYHVMLYLSNYYKTKIIGDARVELHHYMGAVTMIEKANFIKSTKLLIDIGSADAWNAAYLKVPPLSIYDLDPNILHFTSIPTLKHHTETLLNNKMVRTKYIDECYKLATNDKTSYHFTYAIFNHIKAHDIANDLLTYLRELTT